MGKELSNVNRAEYAEKSVIGSILIDESCVDIAMEVLKPPDFYSEMNRIIYSAMCLLASKGEKINLATLLTILATNEYFDNNNGLNYLMSCQSELPSARNIEGFCSMVRSESLRRKVVSFSDTIKAIDWSAVTDIDEEIARLGYELLDISSSTSVSPWCDFGTALRNTLNEVLNTDNSERVRTGFIDLDAKLTGLKPGSLTVIAARPAMGKTALGLNILKNVGINQHIPCVFFSLEMTTSELTKRMISTMTSLNGSAISENKLNREEWNEVMSASERYRSVPIFIDETPGLDIATIQERARRLWRQYGVRFVIIDYLQLISSEGKRIQNREQEIASISRSLKKLAKDLHIPVISLAQLNRSSEARADKHPIMSDLRESGAIEQDADNIIFIHREDYYRQDEEKDNIAEIMIAKQRNGATGIVKLLWESEYTRFSNLESNF